MKPSARKSPACKFWRPAASALLLAFGMAGAANAVDLTVYTAVETEDLKRYAAALNRDHPDINIKWVRGTTGVITSRLLAERNSRRADVVWGLAATSLLALKSAGITLPYRPAGIANLDPKFYDRASPPNWVGMNARVSAVCYNTAEGKKLELRAPRSWKDLTRPAYEGLIAMPNPVSSAAGYLDVSAWIQMFGETAGWDYMDALHENIARYTDSGSQPCTLVASGELPIGISHAHHAARLKTRGAAIEVIIPSEFAGWEVDAAAIVRGTGKLEAAKRLLDWAVSGRAMRVYNQTNAIVASKGAARPVRNFPPEARSKLIENDFEFAAKNRARILEKWKSLFDPEPKEE
ncbi:MAG: putative 2-aminoethylphosphonate ABC transporter substrate-binding protein [Gammaproteobacteria bacterium]|nr:putative 2-aminoethylphosphonate ABC transporter substrate-binding protein [Gammaproteobacteria bacterium]MDA7961865.1 putative 2-aminoethylphosphonate ABC transporter substrate-binding protein [Gammaproteobacteria bacterium]MDA7970274.1 putative 2-aminoethylphosphonate ABC transporter substrate-binding protein [Gammaproteobacteria bacterium]MDA7972248.1 putative 2-aminoethylphosphonate ABC transporter substrate-binding protein [Gammaproteobacteria bacterium]MDA7995886.1 putative 2-aminoethy